MFSHLANCWCYKKKLLTLKPENLQYTNSPKRYTYISQFLVERTCLDITQGIYLFEIPRDLFHASRPWLIDLFLIKRDYMFSALQLRGLILSKSKPALFAYRQFKWHYTRHNEDLLGNRECSYCLIKGESNFTRPVLSILVFFVAPNEPSTSSKKLLFFL